MLCLSLQKRICFAPARQSGPVCRKNFTAPRRHFADIRHNPPHTAARKTLSTFGKTILTLEKTVSTFVFSKVLTVFSPAVSSRRTVAAEIFTTGNGGKRTKAAATHRSLPPRQNEKSNCITTAAFLRIIWVKCPKGLHFNNHLSKSIFHIQIYCQSLAKETFRSTLHWQMYDNAPSSATSIFAKFFLFFAKSFFCTFSCKKHRFVRLKSAHQQLHHSAALTAVVAYLKQINALGQRARRHFAATALLHQTA